MKNFINKIFRIYDQSTSFMQLKARFLLYVYFLLSIGIVVILFYSVCANLNSTSYGFSINIRLTKTSFILFLTANTIALIAIAVITYYVFSFNKRAKVKAESELGKSKDPVIAFMESEEKYKVLMENLNDVVMMVDNDDKILYVNKKFTEKLGYSSEEILGKIGYLYLIAPENQDIIKKTNYKRLSHERSQYELPFIAKNGTVIDFLISGTPIIDSNGKTIGSIGAMTDITDRKESEQALKESEERFKTLSSIASEGLMIHKNGIILDLNQVFANIQGYQNIDDLIGKEALQVLQFTPESKKRVYEHFKNKSDATFDIDIINLNGTIIPVETRGTEIMYKGEPANLVYMRDISDRKKAENALKESEERYRKLIEAFPDIIMVSDLEGKIVFANEPFTEITGILPEDYNNPNRNAHIHPEDQQLVSDSLKDLLSSDKAHTKLIENRFIDTQGKLHWFSGIMAKTFFEGQLFIQTISRDITEKKTVEKELENYRKHLEKLVKERTEELHSSNEELHSSNEELHAQHQALEKTLKELKFAQNQLIQSEKMASLGILTAGVAHEINNPLNYIENGTAAIEDYIKDKYFEEVENLKPLFEAVHIGVERVSGIVKSMSRYSRSEDLPFSNCNIQEVIDDCLIMLQNKYKNRIKIKKNYLPNPPIAFANEGQIHQALLNILANAIQAIEKEGEIVVDVDLVDTKVQVSITDTGKGMSEDQQKHIFDPFFTTKGPGDGTGLGLSITKKIIDEHDGTINCDSVFKKGTKFKVSLPLNIQ
jgi:PAS domain S-box-containing protein